MSREVCGSFRVGAAPQPTCTRPYRHRGPHGDGWDVWKNFGLDLDDEDRENNALLNAEADERDQAKTAAAGDPEPCPTCHDRGEVNSRPCPACTEAYIAP